MSQHDYVINNDSGASVRADINSALQAILSLNSGTSGPTSTSAGSLWLDTSGGAPYALKIRDAGNNHWLTLASVTDPGSDGNIETSATIKGTIDSTATFPSDHIIQVQSTTKTDTTTHTNTTTSIDYSDISGMSVSITPKSGSKIFVSAMLSITATQNFIISYRLARGSTAICVGDQGSSNQTRATGMLRSFSEYVTFQVPIMFLDESPGGDGSTSITYKVQWDGENGSTMFLNRTQTLVDRYDFATNASTITVMEISA